MKRSLVLPLLLASVLTFSVLPGPVSVADDAVPPTDPPASTAESGDNALLAEELGIPEQEVAQWFEGEEEFLAAVEYAKSIAGDQYFYAAWTPGEQEQTGYKGWVSFKGDISQDARERFASLPFPVEVRTDAEFSEGELEQVREEKMTSLEAAGDFEGIVGDIEADGSINIQYESAAELGDTSSSSTESAVAGMSEGSPVKITVTRAEGITPEEETLRGGGSIEGCTLGFTASYRGRAAAMTAGHCPNSPGVPTGSGVSLKFVKQHIGDHGDVQLHTTTETAVNQIRVSRSGDHRSITARGDGVQGSRVCNYGKSRALPSCTTIRNVNHAFIHPDTGSYVSHMVQTNGSFTSSGDSGGPWYYSETARGIHFGKSGGYATYTSILEAEAVLDATVLTS